jgi:hypothetical protein
MSEPRGREGGRGGKREKEKRREKERKKEKGREKEKGKEAGKRGEERGKEGTFVYIYRATRRFFDFFKTTPPPFSRDRPTIKPCYLLSFLN